MRMSPLRRVWLCAVALSLFGVTTSALADAAAALEPVWLYQSAGDGSTPVARSIWLEVLERSGLSWRELPGLQTTTAEHVAPRTLVVVPAASGLSVRERRWLRELQVHGSALLLVGPLGPPARANQLRQLLGVPMRQLSISTKVHLSTVGLTPVSASLSAGTRIMEAMQPMPWVPASQGSWHAAAYYTNWSYRPALENAVVPAVIYGVHGAARWAYLGDPPPPKAAELERLAIMLRDALGWLSAAHSPAIHLADWPSGYRAAHVVEMDTELDDRKDVTKFNAALALGDMVSAVGAHASFYCVSGDMLLRPEVLDRLAGQGHELGFHGERHNPFGQVDPATQLARLQTMLAQWRTLRPASGMLGFRPPYESYDANTERAMLAVGLGYHVSDAPSALHRLPVFVDLGGGQRMLRLARTQPDDYYFDQQHQPAAVVRQQLLQDAAAVPQLGALGWLSLHPQYFEEGSSVRSAFPDWLAWISAPERHIWLTTGARVAQWWHERERVQVLPEPDGVRLQVAEGAVIDSVSLIVDGVLHGRSVRVVSGSGVQVDAPRAWPDASAPILQSELRLRRLSPGITVLSWDSSASLKKSAAMR